jgi:hypothetical protein
MSGPSVGMGYGLMGFGPMGFDDVQPKPSLTPITPPLPPLVPARFWNAETRGFVQLSSGAFAGVDPIDQQVEMLLTIERFSVPALGKIGQNYRRRFLGVPDNKLINIAIDETNVTLSTLLAAGDITIQEVTVTTNPGGSKIVSVAYVNNRAVRGTPNTQSTVTVNTRIGMG